MVLLAYHMQIVMYKYMVKVASLSLLYAYDLCLFTTLTHQIINY